MPGSSAAVCFEHFHPSEIIRKEQYFDKNGNIGEHNLTNAKLKEGSVSHIFKKSPKYSSTTCAPPR